MAKSTSTGVLRDVALGVASVVLLPIAVLLLDKRGFFDRVPNAVVGLFVIVPIAIYLWWLFTHDPVRNRLRLVYNRKPIMLLLILVTSGALIGAALGAFEWWIISKSDAKEPNAIKTEKDLSTVPTETRPTTASEIVSQPSSTKKQSTPPKTESQSRDQNLKQPATGVNQTMTNSPSGIQAGRDVTIGQKPSPTAPEKDKKP